MDKLALARISVSGTRKKPNQPWYSQALKILQRRYLQKERCWKLSMGEAERVDLKLALNSYKEACRVAKSDYFTRKISEAVNSSRELFRTVNILTTPLGTPKVENSQDFCNKVAKFFECKVHDIYSSFRLDKKPANLFSGPTKNLYPGVTMNEVPEKPLVLSKFMMPSNEVLCKLLLEGRNIFIRCFALFPIAQTTNLMKIIEKILGSFRLCNLPIIEPLRPNYISCPIGVIFGLH
ncbi:hypothetical protein NDU88_000391 [Pleurodeles waltl]|uniref:Uncharacterized protein n=1 Tax=Pleurodeles waltl TaxID=8319 RepID=A0AAV7TFB5_PLEWA|nr:hypothetical protein NDU88_000391 [Pleurodeles waltl]